MTTRSIQAVLAEAQVRFTEDKFAFMVMALHGMLDTLVIAHRAGLSLETDAQLIRATAAHVLGLGADPLTAATPARSRRFAVEAIDHCGGVVVPSGAFDDEPLKSATEFIFEAIFGAPWRTFAPAAMSE